VSRFPTSSKGCAALLAERRNAKMARSARAYMRGNTVKFYEWLETAAGKAIPLGPPVWICGDCHIGNLGPIANLEGRVDIQIVIRELMPQDLKLEMETLTPDEAVGAARYMASVIGEAHARQMTPPGGADGTRRSNPGFQGY